MKKPSSIDPLEAEAKGVDVPGGARKSMAVPCKTEEARIQKICDRIEAQREVVGAKSIFYNYLMGPVSISGIPEHKAEDEPKQKQLEETQPQARAKPGLRAPKNNLQDCW